MRRLLAIVLLLGSLLLTGARCGSGARGGDSVHPNRYVNTPTNPTPPGTAPSTVPPTSSGG